MKGEQSQYGFSRWACPLLRLNVKRVPDIITIPFLLRQPWHCMCFTSTSQPRRQHFCAVFRTPTDESLSVFLSSSRMCRDSNVPMMMMMMMIMMKKRSCTAEEYLAYHSSRNPDLDNLALHFCARFPLVQTPTALNVLDLTSCFVQLSYLLMVKKQKCMDHRL
jgi:hypothetical protein